ncbi:hypothetical protein AgCh_023132 [Apium graveolens]
MGICCVSSSSSSVNQTPYSTSHISSGGISQTISNTTSSGGSNVSGNSQFSASSGGSEVCPSGGCSVMPLPWEIRLKILIGAARGIQRGLDPDSDNLSIIIESLSLAAELKESIALEKERMRVVTNKSQGDIDLTNQLVRGRAVTRFYRNG